MKTVHNSPLPHFNERPPGISIDTLIIHSMCARAYPESEVEPKICIGELDRHQVSAHYLIDRQGIRWKLVEEKHRAWHAGVSRLPDQTRLTDQSHRREGVNDFSIGIELLAEIDSKFTEAQYDSLIGLIQEICSRHPLRYILGHQHIAQPPGRKTDPGKLFNWHYLRTKLQADISNTRSKVVEKLLFPSDFGL